MSRSWRLDAGRDGFWEISKPGEVTRVAVTLKVARQLLLILKLRDGEVSS